MYNSKQKFTWNEAKRQANLAKHGLDLADAENVFAGPMVLFEDDREDYGEQRKIVISMRKAESDETDIYYQNVGYL